MDRVTENIGGNKTITPTVDSRAQENVVVKDEDWQIALADDRNWTDWPDAIGTHLSDVNPSNDAEPPRDTRYPGHSRHAETRCAGQSRGAGAREVCMATRQDSDTEDTDNDNNLSQDLRSHDEVQTSYRKQRVSI